jgi:hypothetical protein
MTTILFALLIISLTVVWLSQRVGPIRTVKEYADDGLLDLEYAIAPKTRFQVALQAAAPWLAIGAVLVALIAGRGGC